MAVVATAVVVAAVDRPGTNVATTCQKPEIPLRKEYMVITAFLSEAPLP